MPAITASQRRAAAESTLELPFRIPPQEWFTCRQAGAVLGLAESTVEKLYEQRRFPVGHNHNAGTGERMHKRIHRLSLIAYALATADYDDQSLYEALVFSLRHCPAPWLLWLAEQLRRIAADVPPMPGAGRAFPCPQPSGKR